MAAVPTISDEPIKVDSSSTSITLSWELTSNGGAPITGYKLYQTNVTTGGVYEVYDGTNIPTVSSFKVVSLTPGHLYAYQVSGINRIGEGLLSAITEDFYSATKPGRPEPPRFVQADSTLIEVLLTSLADNGGSSILEYRLYIDDGDESQENWS